MHRWQFLLASALACASACSAQVVLSGRIALDPSTGSTARVFFGGVCCFGTVTESGVESRGFRSWETEPPGWFRLSGPAGNYSLLFTQPAGYVRPVLRHNLFTRAGDRLEHLGVRPRFDYAEFHERAWDPKPATEYFQKFVAVGTGLTHVGFKLATDGIDGAGPKSQNLLLSVHRVADGEPESWPQIGSAALVPDVDCGGPKSYAYSAGWNSGEVPLVPGERYAIRLRAETPGHTFQAFWRTNAASSDQFFRVGGDTRGLRPGRLWMAIATDGDGLAIPFNKRVHKQFGPFAGFAKKWSQTYVTRGRSLAGVVLYAAVGGAQPPLSRQRCAVRVRRDGPDGPAVGVEKIAIGNGNYTGDASWGTFGVACAPDEIPLTPGQRYAIEFESLESYHTLHGFVNIKGQVSDDRPGFNPYRKHARDVYEPGTAYKHGNEAQDFDLDMQVIEHEASAARWDLAVHQRDLARDGDFEVADAGAAGDGVPASWKSFATEGRLLSTRPAEPPENTNHFARLQPGQGKIIDGGWVQRVTGLDPMETYRLGCRVRASWAADAERQCYVGCDPTGQDANPRAASIVWTTLPPRRGEFVLHLSEPIRPLTNAVTLWLRARVTSAGERYAPFAADFDDVTLRQVRTDSPP